MKLTTFPQFKQFPLQVALITTATVIYCGAFLAFYPTRGVTISSLSVLPVIVAGWVLGVRGGLVAGLLTIPLSMLLLVMVGEPAWANVLMRGTFGFVAVFVVGAVVGRLHDLDGKVRQELTERKQMESELTSLYRATSFLFKASSLQTLGSQIVQAVAQEFHHFDCGLLLIDQEQNKMTYLARNGEFQINPTIVLELNGQGLVPEVVRTGSVVYVPDVKLDPRCLTDDVRTRSELVIPLHNSKGVLGVLDLQSSQPHAFSQRDQRVLFAFAERAAAELENRLLYEQLNQHASELEWRVAKRTAELVQAKDRIEAILNNSSDAVVLIDGAARIQQTNYSFSQLFGYGLDETFRNSLFTLIATDNIKALDDMLPSVIEDQQSARTEVTCRHKDGSVFEADLALAPLLSEHGTSKIICSFRDITERKERDQALQKKHEEEREFQKYLQTLFEISIELTMVENLDEFYKHIVQTGLTRLGFDRMGLFVYDPARNMALGTYGTDTEGHLRCEQHLQFVVEPRGGMWKSMQTPSRFYLEEQKDLVHDLSVVGNGWNVSVALWHGNHNLGWLVADNLIHHKPVTQSQLEILAQYGVYIAASMARKRAEEAARQAFVKEAELVELKSRFVSMASHEFRTPLATILAITETLSAYRHKLTDDQIDERITKLQIQVGHLTNIIDDVLQLARMQARRIEFHPVNVDLDALLQSELDEFQSRSDIVHKLEYSCNTPFPEAKLDKKLMHQIINNLLSNAIKYSPSTKPVTVSLNHISETLIVKVSDQGIGIPEADLKHLFEPFHRASNVGVVSGTGLGLVITKEAVELHGGTISVESVVNHGTSFIVSLPQFFESGA